MPLADGGGKGAPGRLGGGGRLAPVGFGGSGICPVGGTERLPAIVGGVGGLGRADAAGAGVDAGILICIVERDSSLPAWFAGKSMRMVSRLAPGCVGRLMRMVSFFASPIRTVSFFTPELA